MFAANRGSAATTPRTNERAGYRHARATVWLVATAVSWAVTFLWAGSAFADLAVRQLQIAAPAPRTRVPEVTTQGRFLAPQAVSAVDVAGDGKVITVGTMAFSHDANVWQEPGGTVSWNRPIEGTEIPPRAWVPREVVPGLPVFQGGRISRAENAYVGDIWVIRNGRKAVVVDAGGVSGFSETQARLRALEVDQVTHVLQTHSHGDHCGGAYLFRAAGAQIVGPKSAAFSLTWLMPMLTDYGIYPPRPLSSLTSSESL